MNGGSLTTGACNVVIGYNAGNSCTSSNNVFLGKGVAQCATLTGGSNVFLGQNAGCAADGTSQMNVAIGNGSGRNLNGGQCNVFLGKYAGAGVNSGSHNIGLGYASAGDATGSYNITIGNSVQVTGSKNLAIGCQTSRWITGDSSFNVTLAGIVTATTAGNVCATAYYGDGSNLTNLPASGVVPTENTTNQAQFIPFFVGTAQTSIAGISSATLVFNPSTNRLGVGTDSPQATLHVVDEFLVSTAGAASTQRISQKAYTTDNGTLSWEGSAGQLFSITNNLTSGSIFSVNDVSGIPSIDVDADGTIQLAPFGSTEFVGVGTTNPSAKLDVNGTLNVSGISTFGDELHVGYQKEIYFNNNSVYNAFQISQNGSTQSLIKNNVSAGNILIATGNAGSGYVQITNISGGETAAKFTPGGSTELHYDGNKKLETTTSGVTVTGTATATDFNSTSDARLKTNVQVIDDPLEKVLQINGVSFNWIENNKPSMGVIADNIQEVLPELVSDTNPKTVNYNGLIGLLIEVVKEQQTQINSLNERLSRLE